MGIKGSGSQLIGLYIWLQMGVSAPYSKRTQEVSSHDGNLLGDLQYSPGSSVPGDTAAAS